MAIADVLPPPGAGRAEVHPPPAVGAPTELEGDGQLLPGLSVVLACRDDADTIADAIWRALVAAERSSREYEVVVVDDASADATPEIAATFVARGARVRLLLHATPRGQGAALRSGLQAACQPWVLLTDASTQVDLRVLEELLPALPGAGVLVGWRILRRGTAARRLAAAAWNALIRRLFDVPFRDIDCPFKLVRREAALELPLHADGPMFSAELLVRMLAHGDPAVEVGLRHALPDEHRRQALSVRTVARAARELVALLRELRGVARQRAR